MSHKGNYTNKEVSASEELLTIITENFSFREGLHHLIQAALNKLSLVMIIELLCRFIKIKANEESQTAENTGISLKAFIEEYTGHLMNVSQKHMDSVKLVMKYAIEVFRKDKKINSISQNEAESFIKHLQARAPKGYRLYFRNIRAAFNYAVERDYISKNPFNSIKLPKEQQIEPSTITKEALEKVISHSRPVMKDIIILAYYTGMRLGEIVNMKIAWINLDKRMITIGDKSYKTKSRKQRVIPIHNAIFEMLQEKLCKNTRKDDFVFYLKPGVKLREDTVTKWFKVACIDAELDKSIHFHCLRHSFASNLSALGTSANSIKNILGHSSLEITQRYMHEDHAVLLESVNKIQ